jgi:ribosome maturation protein SDO1
MSSKRNIVARLAMGGDHFEILVDPDLALAYKLGKKRDISKILAIEEIYTDSKKGLRAPSERLQSRIGTSDILKAATIILERGELQLTVEQRRGLIDEKKKQIIATITGSCLDIRTGLPVPATRVEQAMGQVGISIDPFKSGEEQAKAVIGEIKKVLPLKVQVSEIEILAPRQSAPKVQAFCRLYGDLMEEKVLGDGSTRMRVSIPSISKAIFLEKLARDFAQVKANVLK